MATASDLAARRVTTYEPVRLELDDGRWSTFVESRPESLPFHHPAWAQLLSACYRLRAFALTLVDSDGAVVAGLPVVETRNALGRPRWVSLPFTDICPPLISPAADGASFARTLAEIRKQSGIPFFEVRSPLPGTVSYHRSDAVIHTLELGPDPDAVFATFHRSQVQRNVRRAGREPIAVRRGETRKDLTETFYRLHLHTRRRLGVPVQPRRFFEELWMRLLEPGLGRLLLAWSGTEAVAGAVFLTSRRSVTYKYGASNPCFWRLRPNHLIFWTAIEEACNEGYWRFDFGRSELDDAGLREFKSGWGTREEALCYSTLAERPPAEGRGLAVGVARSLLRRSPAWACRLTGEVFYRYAA